MIGNRLLRPCAEKWKFRCKSKGGTGTKLFRNIALESIEGHEWKYTIFLGRFLSSKVVIEKTRYQ